MTTDYKHTLQLPKTAFSMKANLPQREPEIQKKWSQQNLYQALRDSRASAEKFILHDGPPYANGDLHLGHAVNKILKDIVVKNKSMQGLDAPFVPGWDCHGLPIENQVEKKIGKAGVKGSMADFREACRQYAQRQVQLQMQNFQKMGVLADWDSPYLTIQRQVEADTVRALAELHNSGNLFCDVKPVYWSVVGQSALAEAEVEYYDKKSDAIDVTYKVRAHSLSKLYDIFKLSLSEQSIRFVIWTTTPWTIPASQAISINPKMRYALVQLVDKSFIILVEDLVTECLERYNTSGTIVATCSGGDLVHIECQHPLYSDRIIPLLCGDHVTLKGGTGCVHTAPDHGLDDFFICKKNGIKPLHFVAKNGVFTEKTPLFTGQHVYKVDGQVIAALEQSEALLCREQIVHSYPHCWRTKTPLIFLATKQWFVPKLTDAAIDAALEAVVWQSDKDRSRMQLSLQSAPDWCISRQRVWGTPLPLIIHKDSGALHPNMDTILQRVADAIQKDGMDAWFESSIDTWIQNDLESYTMLKDTVDVWFDSGVSFYSVLRRRSQLSVPASLYLEGVDQFRGWFQSSIKTSVAIQGFPPYREVVSHGFVVDKNGKKMSKSEGNVITPQSVIQQYGADVLRLWVATTNYTNQIKMSQDALSRTADLYRRLRNTLRYCLANLNGFTIEDSIDETQMLELDKWVCNRAFAMQDEAIRHYNNYEIRLVVQQLNHFCSEVLSSFYLDIIKDRIYTSHRESSAYCSAQTAIYKIVQILVPLLAPILSHTAEEAWQYIPNTKVNSVHLTTYSKPQQLKQQILDANWDKLLALKLAFNQKAEILRKEGIIGGTLDIAVTIKASPLYHQDFDKLRQELRFILISSSVELLRSKDLEEFELELSKSQHPKCARCWHLVVDIGANKQHPNLCLRCVGNIGTEHENRVFA